MPPIAIREEDLVPGAGPGEALLGLNNAHAMELSLLDRARFARLVRHSFAAWRVAPARALLLAFDQAAEYDSANFLWFRDRLDRFVYVDRIVVTAEARGQGVARGLYRALFAAARQAGHATVACEVNAEPPNPQSDAFHAALGFTAIGTGRPYGGPKTVRYMACALGA